MKREDDGGLSLAFSASIYAAWLGAVLIMYCPFSGGAYLQAPGLDASEYLKMADNAFATVTHPYALRLMTPWLVGRMRAASHERLDWDFCWYFLDFVALLGTGIVFHLFLRNVLKIRGYVTTIFVLILLSNFVYSVFLFRDAFLVDPLNNLFWMLALYCLFSERFTPFVVVLSVGMVNKEVILFLAPLYPIFVALRSGTIRDARFAKSVGTIALLGAFYLAYRFAAEAYLGHQYQLFATARMTRYETLVNALNGQKSIWRIIETFQFFWVIFAFALGDLISRHGWRNRFVVASIYLLATLSFGRLFATDANRVFAMAAPLVIGLSAAFFSSPEPRIGRFAAVMLLANIAINVEPSDNPQYQLAVNIAMLAGALILRRGPLTDDVEPATAAALARI